MESVRNPRRQQAPTHSGSRGCGDGTAAGEEKGLFAELQHRPHSQAPNERTHSPTRLYSDDPIDTLTLLLPQTLPLSNGRALSRSRQAS